MFTTKLCKDSVLVLSAAKIFSSDSLVPRLSPHANERKGLGTASDGKLGGAWEQGYSSESFVQYLSQK